MTPFSALQSLCGLSNREAGEFLNSPETTIEKWRRASDAKSAREAPDGVLAELLDLWAIIDNTAAEIAEDLKGSEAFEGASEIEIGYPADDHEARDLGFPAIGAWRQMFARLLDELKLADPDFDLRRIKLVPRGSRVATAGASDRRDAGGLGATKKPRPA